MDSTWMGDDSRVGCGCCSYKYCKIPEAEKRGLHYMLLGVDNYRINCVVFGYATSYWFTIMAVNSAKTHSWLTTGFKQLLRGLIKQIRGPCETYPWPGLFKAKITCEIWAWYRRIHVTDVRCIIYVVFIGDGNTYVVHHCLIEWIWPGL